MMAEIAWMPWSDAAFERAAAEDKPILLSISAVWCHWCHVMDDTTYADPDVARAINAQYVAIRVDNDERPDVNARYNMGGWPTTAFLAPDGTTLTGATYLPAAQMRQALDRIARFYHEEKDTIAARSGERQPLAPQVPLAHTPLDTEMIERVCAEIVGRYDAEFGGFGDAPKFPQPEVLDFLLAEWRVRNDEHLYDIVARTLRSMAHGGMYDHVEGGFFRYSTTRDWSVPHFEKMAEDHAGLLRVLAQMQLYAPASDMRDTLRSATRYVQTVLRDARSGLFAGSQDADEAYFALTLEERRTRSAPFVDRRSYSNWSAALAGACAWVAIATDDDELAGEALQALDALHERLLDDDGLLYHVLPPAGPPRVRGMLTDQSAYLRALLDVHEITGERRLLDRACAHAEQTLRFFGADGGGFYDHARRESAIGRLQVPDRPIVENAIMAESLIRLGVMTGERRWTEAARDALVLYARTYASAGTFAATYARALRRYLSPVVSVRIEGSRPKAAALREAARHLPSPFTTVYAGNEGNETPSAYLCLGTSCAAPVSAATALRAAYDDLARETPADDRRTER